MGRVKHKKEGEENADVTPRKTRSQKSNAQKIDVPKVKRRALSDKTNSGSDNQSSSSSPVSPIAHNGVRPKRARHLPARFLNHELSAVKQNNKKKQHISSTPIDKHKSEKASRQSVDNIQNGVKLKRKLQIESNNENTIKPNKQNNRVNNKLDELNCFSKKIVEPELTEKIRSNTAALSFPASKIVPYRTCKNWPAPIWNDKRASLNEPDLNGKDLYEFQVDPNETPVKAKKRPKAIKKKTIAKATIREIVPKRKKLTVLSEDTVKYLMRNMEKEKNANLFRELKLRSALKKTNNGNGCENPETTQGRPPTVDNNKMEKLQTVPNQHGVVVRNQLVVEDKNLPVSPDVFSVDDFILDEVCDEELAFPSTSHDSTRINQKFFGVPLASSSMIKCVDNNRPSGSPWRVDLDVDKPKRGTNFYVKPSMTPAYERDTFYILGLDEKHNSDLNKKHNNSNIVIEKSAPKRASASALFADNGIEIKENGTVLKQPSILSFFKESFSKPNKRGRKPKKNVQKHSSDEFLSESTSSEHTSSLNELDKNTKPTVVDCFGFEEDFGDIENENIPLVNTKMSKLNKKDIHQSTPRKKRALMEQNKYVKAPTRITQKEIKNVLKMKNKITPLLNEANISVVDEEKTNSSINISSDSDTSAVENNTGSTSQESSIGKEAGLFEDPKEEADVTDKILSSFTEPPRKMYERKKRPPKKFKEIEEFLENNSESENDNDYVFSIKSGKVKKTKKKQQHNPLTKEETKQMKNWATGYNSMLGEAEEFPLCVE